MSYMICERNMPKIMCVVIDAYTEVALVCISVKYYTFFWLKRIIAPIALY